MGHGGADSKKLWVLFVQHVLFMLTHRIGNDTETPQLVKDYLTVTEIFQIKYTNEEGKIKKFKPAVGVYARDTVYLDGKKTLLMLLLS